MDPREAVFTGKHSTLYPQFVKTALVTAKRLPYPLQYWILGAFHFIRRCKKYIRTVCFATINASYDRICARDAEREGNDTNPLLPVHKKKTK
ncbi:MAG TPA: hypothetical protein DCL58_07705 [Synergistaceae bacterium]|jgi:hypothetical protein|nr:hypothetical protein [Synergistaceae bacterium]